jgi:hypothetical protein
MSLLQRISEIEGEIDRTQRNKATEKHLGQLKAKLAKLKSEVCVPHVKRLLRPAARGREPAVRLRPRYPGVARKKLTLISAEIILLPLCLLAPAGCLW